MSDFGLSDRSFLVGGESTEELLGEVHRCDDTDGELLGEGLAERGAHDAADGGRRAGKEMQF